MIRSFQFRLLPNATQRAALERILDDNAETYNAALQERIEAWKLQRKSISYRDQQNELTELRQDPAFQWMAVDIQRDPLRRVDLAFRAFFRRCKAGQKPGFPRFRSRFRYDSFSFCRPARNGRSIKIPNLGYIRMRGGREIRGVAKECNIKRDGERWTASVVCDIGPAPEKRAVSTAIGIDVGVASLISLSNGVSVDNPRWTKRHERRITEASRSLARKQKRSNNRSRAKGVLVRAHQRAANARSNYLHHISKMLVAQYHLIAHEELSIRSMSQGRFAKSILDAAWGILLFQLKYKAEEAGTWVVPVNPRGTSQRCSGCGEVVKKTLSQRVHSCPKCGLELGRDHNAALNILALGTSAVRGDPGRIYTGKCHVYKSQSGKD